MYAIGLTQYGGPEVLKTVELPTPSPSEGEVRIKVKAAGINPVDVMVREGLLDGMFKDLEKPYVPGMDVSGVIDEVGAGVDERLIGKEVVGVVNNAGNYGAYSEYICLPQESVIEKPAGKSFPEAASFLMNGLTARNALDALDLPQGSTILVTGAAGAVGNYAVCQASDDGLKVIAVASDKDEQDLLKAGAAHFISRDKQVPEAVKSLFPDGVDAVIDAAGVFDEILPAIKDNGVIIVLRFKKDATMDRGVRSRFVNVRERAKDTRAIAEITRKVAAGKLSTRVAAVYKPEDAAAAHRKMAEKGLRGRVVLDFSR